MSTNTLVVHYHPQPDSLTRAALDRVIAGLNATNTPTKVLDLADGFDPVLSLREWQGHIEDEPDVRQGISEHIEALQWASRLVLVYPTWFGGQPAPVKGWFDRVWINGVAWELPEGKNLLRGLLKNIRSINIVTTHGSSRLVNAVQGNPGKVTVMRGLRLMCHPLCRTRWTALYRLDQCEPDDIEAWLSKVEQRFGAKP